MILIIVLVLCLLMIGINARSLANLKNVNQRSKIKKVIKETRKYYLNRHIKGFLNRNKVSVQVLAKILDLSKNQLIYRLNKVWSSQGLGAIERLLQPIGKLTTADIQNYRQDKNVLKAFMLESMSFQPQIKHVYDHKLDSFEDLRCKKCSEIREGGGLKCAKCGYVPKLVKKVAVKYSNMKQGTYKEISIKKSESFRMLLTKRILRERYVRIFKYLDDKNMILTESENRSYSQIHSNAVKRYLQTYPLRSSRYHNLMQIARIEKHFMRDMLEQVANNRIEVIKPKLYGKADLIDGKVGLIKKKEAQGNLLKRIKRYKEIDFNSLPNSVKQASNIANKRRQYREVIATIVDLLNVSKSSEERRSIFKNYVKNAQGVSKNIKKEVWDIAKTEYLQTLELNRFMLYNRRKTKYDHDKTKYAIETKRLLNITRFRSDILGDRYSFMKEEPKDATKLKAMQAVYSRKVDYDTNLMISFDKKDNPIQISVMNRSTFKHEDMILCEKAFEHNIGLKKAQMVDYPHGKRRYLLMPQKHESFSYESYDNNKFGTNLVDHIDQGNAVYHVELPYFAYLIERDQYKQAEKWVLKHKHATNLPKWVERGLNNKIVMKFVKAKGKDPQGLAKRGHDQLFMRNIAIKAENKSLLNRLVLCKTTIPFESLERYEQTSVKNRNYYKKRFVKYDKKLNPIFRIEKNRLSVSDRKTEKSMLTSKNFELTKHAMLDIDIQAQVQKLYRLKTNLLGDNVSEYTQDNEKELRKQIKKAQKTLQFKNYFTPKLHDLEGNIKFQRDDYIRAMNKYFSGLNRSIRYTIRDSSTNGKSYLKSEMNYSLPRELKEKMQYIKKLRKYARYNTKSKRHFRDHSVSIRTLVKNAKIFEAKERIEFYEKAIEMLKFYSSEETFNLEVIEGVLFNLWKAFGDKIGFKPIFRIARKPISFLKSETKKLISEIGGDYEIHSKKGKVIKSNVDIMRGKLLYSIMKGTKVDDIPCSFCKNIYLEALSSVDQKEEKMPKRDYRRLFVAYPRICEDQL